VPRPLSRRSGIEFRIERAESEPGDPKTARQLDSARSCVLLLVVIGDEASGVSLPLDDCASCRSLVDQFGDAKQDGDSWCAWTFVLFRSSFDVSWSYESYCNVDCSVRLHGSSSYESYASYAFCLYQNCIRIVSELYQNCIRIVPCFDSFHLLKIILLILLQSFVSFCWRRWPVLCPGHARACGELESLRVPSSSSQKGFQGTSKNPRTKLEPSSNQARTKLEPSSNQARWMTC